MVGAPVAHGVLEGAGFAEWTWLVDLPAAVLLLRLTVRWGFGESLRNRLLAMLHISKALHGVAILTY